MLTDSSAGSSWLSLSTTSVCEGTSAGGTAPNSASGNAGVSRTCNSVMAARWSRASAAARWKALAERSEKSIGTRILLICNMGHLPGT